MKITKKILENLIREEINKALLSEAKDVLNVQGRVKKALEESPEAAITTLADLLSMTVEHLIFASDQIDRLEERFREK